MSNALSAFAQTGVYLTELAGPVSVKQLNATDGDILFTQLDAAGDAESFELPASGQLSAAKGSITLQLADDVTFASGSQITAMNTVTRAGGPSDSGG